MSGQLKALAKYQHNKSVSFWMVKTDLARCCRQYIITAGDRLSRGDILVTPIQCAGTYITYTRSLAVCYAEQAAACYSATAAVCSGKNRQTGYRHPTSSSLYLPKT